MELPQKRDVEEEKQRFLKQQVHREAPPMGNVRTTINIPTHRTKASHRSLEMPPLRTAMLLGGGDGRVKPPPVGKEKMGFF